MILRRITLTTVLTSVLTASAIAQVIPTPPQPPLSITHPEGAVDMTAPVLDLTGQPINDGSVPAPDPKPDGWKPSKLTYGHAIAQALCNDLPGDRTSASETGIVKAKRCDLGFRIMDDPTAVLTTDEKKTIEDRLGIWPGVINRNIVKHIAPQDLTK